MARRRKEWQEEPEEQAPEQEAAPPSRDESETEEEKTWRNARSPQEALLRLQRVAGNQSTIRIMQRFSVGAPPGLEGEEEEEAGVERPAREVRPLHELADEEPDKQLAAFQEMEYLPPEAEKLVEEAAKISASPQAELGPLAQLLKIQAQALLGQAPSQETEVILDKLCAAVADAWAQWKLKATLTQVTIMAMTATGGEIVAPDFGTLIRANARVSSEAEAEAVVRLVGPLGQAFNRWQRSVEIAGLPLYPTFAAVPGPMAPPTPSVPMPLAALKSDLGSFNGIQGSVKADDPNADAAARAVAAAMASVFPKWVGLTWVMNLLGMGPVPTFAPPLVPVGPVIGGTVLPLPGCFI